MFMINFARSTPAYPPPGSQQFPLEASATRGVSQYLHPRAIACPPSCEVSVFKCGGQASKEGKEGTRNRGAKSVIVFLIRTRYKENEVSGVFAGKSSASPCFLQAEKLEDGPGSSQASQGV